MGCSKQCKGGLGKPWLMGPHLRHKAPPRLEQRKAPLSELEASPPSGPPQWRHTGASRPRVSHQWDPQPSEPLGGTQKKLFISSRSPWAQRARASRPGDDLRSPQHSEHKARGREFWQGALSATFGVRSPPVDAQGLFRHHMLWSECPLPLVGVRDVLRPVVDLGVANRRGSDNPNEGLPAKPLGGTTMLDHSLPQQRAEEHSAGPVQQNPAPPAQGKLASDRALSSLYLAWSA